MLSLNKDLIHQNFRSSYCVQLTNLYASVSFQHVHFKYCILIYVDQFVLVLYLSLTMWWPPPPRIFYSLSLHLFLISLWLYISWTQSTMLLKCIFWSGPLTDKKLWQPECSVLYGWTFSFNCWNKGSNWKSFSNREKKMYSIEFKSTIYFVWIKVRDDFLDQSHFRDLLHWINQVTILGHQIKDLGCLFVLGQDTSLTQTQR